MLQITLLNMKTILLELRSQDYLAGHPSALGWCEIELLVKSQNPQAVYDSLIIPEKLL